MRQLWILVFAALASACAPEGDTEAVDRSTAPAANAAPAPAAGEGEPDIADVPPSIAVTPNEIAYGAAGERLLNGYFVAPGDVVEPPPGIILIHDERGLTDYVRAMARRLGGEGYAVLAIDLYGGQTAATAEQVETLRSEFLADRAAVLDNISQARGFLEQNALAPRVAAVGFGLGGELSLDAALTFGDGIDVVVMFYGRMVNDRGRLESLSAPLLGIFASLDDTIPVREVTQFRSTLRELDKTSLVLIHSNVEHDFANSESAAYDHAAAVENWDNVVEFLAGNLR
jgi:carboxymethylenebutenolidase